MASDIFSQDLELYKEEENKKNTIIRKVSLKELNVKTKSYFSNEINIYENIEFKKKNLLNDIYCFDTAKNKKDTVIKFEMKKNPWMAVLYSALLPGLGQFYNESYWKVPIVVGIGGYLGYIIVKNHGDYLDYRDLYAESQTPENPNGDTRLKEFREFYRNQRDQFLLYFLFFYVITAVDAYVDANLYDFDVTDYMRLSILGRKGILNLNIGF
jgi:hypothetical protein